MTLRLMGKKRGMTQRFDSKGNAIVCTVIEVSPNVVTQLKNEENDGYSALQLGFDEIVTGDARTAEKRVGKPLSGHYKKAGVAPQKHLGESRVEDTSQFQVGQKLGVENFKEVKFVDVEGVSKGKGYQGTMRLYNFAGGPASHGSGFHRHSGSTGMRTTPGRCFPGGKRASHMGVDKVTVQNLRVVDIDETKGALLVEGAVPGPNGALVYVSKAKKI